MEQSAIVSVTNICNCDKVAFSRVGISRKVTKICTTHFSFMPNLLFGIAFSETVVLFFL